MGSRRLLPLLALLGAAGLQSSEWEGPPAQEPSTVLEPEQPLPGSAAPPSSTRKPPSSPLFSTPPQPSLAGSSADPEPSPGGGPDGAASLGYGPALGTAGGRTRPPLLEAGRTATIGGPSAPGPSLPPQPTSASATASLLTLLPVSALLPGSSPPEDIAGPTPSPPSAAGGVSRSGLEESTLGRWGQGASRASWTEAGPRTPEPGSTSPAEGTAAAAGRGAPGVADAAEGWRTPAVEPPRESGASSRMPPESKSRPPTAETPGGRPLAPTWPPASRGGPPPSETLGPGGEAATDRAQPTRLPPPRDRSSSSALAVGLEPYPQPPGGSEAPEQLELTPGRDPEAESTGLVGPHSLGTALPPALAGAGHALEATEEAAVPDSTGGGTAAPDPRSAALGQGGRGRAQALPPSAAAPNQGAGGAEVAPHSSSGAVPSLVGSTTHPAGADPALDGSSPPPGPASLASSVGPAQPPADATEGPAALRPGQEASPATAPPRSPADPPPASALRQDRDGETWGSPDPPGPSRTRPAPSSPGPSRPPPQGAFPGPACSSPETPARPADAGEGVQGEQPVGGGLAPDAAPRQTSQLATDGALMGTAAEEVQPLVSQTPGSLTGSPKGSGTAPPSAERDAWNLAPSKDPAWAPSQTAALSTPAEPLREAGASDRPWVTLWPGASPARTQRWAWGRHPGVPTESSAREKLARAPHSTGPGQSVATSGPLESAWLPGPEPGSASGGDPPVDSTRRLAPGPGEAPTHPAPAVPSDARGRGRHVFVAGNQLPILKATSLRVPCELVLAMEFSRSFRNPRSPEYQGLVLSVNGTVAPLLAPLPGFQRLEVKTIRPGSVVVEFDALFLAEAPGLWAALNRSWLAERLPPGLRVGDARVLRSMTLERRLDLCATLFACHAGYECVAGEDGNAACTSLCHRDYCQNQGICTHEVNHVPVCQCPVGSDFWYLGLRCNYKVTQQGLLGVACGLILSLALVGTAVASLVIRRVRTLLLEARADQTKSSYRRFCRLDDVSAHYWSEPWLASGSSLDNPAFSNSEELLHLQILDPDCCGCQDDCGAPSSCCKQTQDTPCISAAGRPSFRFSWDTSSTSVNDPMIDSGKASEVSVSSWPLEPSQWSPFPVLHQLSGQQAHKSPPRPHSYCEGVELVNLERSWTA